jgi:hypothetical protein
MANATGAHKRFHNPPIYLLFSLLPSNKLKPQTQGLAQIILI